MLQQLLGEAERYGVEVVWRPLHESTGGGVCAWVSGRPYVFVDPRLHPRERVEVLAHELAHALRGWRPDAGVPAWRPVVAREESRVDDDAALMLVDLEALSGFTALAEAQGCGLTADEIADTLDVTRSVAERALRLMADRAPPLAAVS